MIKKCVLLILLAAFVSNGLSEREVNEAEEKRWGKDIKAFMDWDAKNSVPDDAVLFLGSSSARGWQTARFFPEFKVINRGFGGSQTPAVNYFFDRIAAPYNPKVICLYVGDNDITAGNSPEKVFADFKEFKALCEKYTPDAQVVYLSIKPSGSRWNVWPQMKAANALIEAHCGKFDNFHYVDVATCLLDESGKPNDELFLGDRLHLNEKGYTVWTNTLRPTLEKLTSDKECKD
ncbi:Argininosuccinate lyase [Limihaloglobus sulfuriphilus]|uniref:Argininosuccinate lyase n=1 Tax=Limihaloglobus sulfuriphilus TaxID=1851148 RepID=A0A1Q2MHI1_9BACT|nr:GDSL-type esterase/lipase family protein [Limihaloglobus sulfuriphilus]AQQ72109.1 Argininosuccinate lyase [Limihaloglobus sulfuriphilus]